MGAGSLDGGQAGTEEASGLGVVAGRDKRVPVQGRCSPPRLSDCCLGSLVPSGALEGQGPSRLLGLVAWAADQREPCCSLSGSAPWSRLPVFAR